MEVQLSAYFQRLIDERHIPGCALLVRKNGKEIYHACHGYADIERQIPVQDDTIYPVCSMTKLVVAVAIMMLAERGLLSVNDNLNHFFPAYPEWKKRVRVRHLLSHCASLGARGGPAAAYALEHSDIRASLAETVESWGSMPYDCELGESAEYSYWINFDILGRIIEVVSGMRLDQFLDKEILKPLKMFDSFFLPQEGAMEQAATVYVEKNGGLIPATTENTNLGAREFASGDIRIMSSETYISGCGGLLSTLHDYDRFTSMLANGGELDGIRILKPETIALMHTPRQLTDAERWPGCPWGLGFMVFEHPERSGIHVLPGTYGWSGAYGTHMFIHEGSGISATFMLGMGDSDGCRSAISREIERIVFDL